MTSESRKLAALAILKRSPEPLGLSKMLSKLGAIPERTLRRWLLSWVKTGVVEKHGRGRATRYRYIGGESDTTTSFAFLTGLDKDLKRALLTQLRDLWTHNSTAIEGNTLSLGDTHFVLEEGLTISGKPLKDHQEVIGHAKAIELIYTSLQEPLSETLLFALHQAIQSEHVIDIYKPCGNWKVEPNGTYALTTQGKQVFIEYALPIHVPKLMSQLIDYVNVIDINKVTITNAPVYYARIHMGIAHIHPFWDGNGRIARLIANIPLLKAGLPPLVIPQAKRRHYIQTLADYQIYIGQLDAVTGIWPKPKKLQAFEQFCREAYSTTKALVEKAFESQAKRSTRNS